MYKLICVDLDGTLLNSRGYISETNKKAIRDALDHGVEVAIVSGRPNCFTTRIIKQIDMRMGHVTFNGAYYRIAGKQKYFPIAFDTVKKIAAIAKKYDVRIYFKNKNLAIVTKDDPGILDYDNYKEETALKDRLDFHYDVDAATYFETQYMDVLKIFAWDSNRDALSKAAKEISELDHINFYEYADYFELSSNQTSKGKAILSVAEELNIKPEEIMCIGDNYNDVPMFQIGATSVAMKNADEKIKQMCDIVTLSNDDNGVAYAINKYVLGEK